MMSSVLGSSPIRLLHQLSICLSVYLSSQLAIYLVLSLYLYFCRSVSLLCIQKLLWCVYFQRQRAPVMTSCSSDVSKLMLEMSIRKFGRRVQNHRLSSSVPKRSGTICYFRIQLTNSTSAKFSCAFNFLGEAGRFCREVRVAVWLPFLGMFGYSSQGRSMHLSI